MTVVIRPAREADAAQMAALLNPIILAGGWTEMSRVVTAEEQAAFVRAFPATGVFLVAEDGGCVVGMQDVQPTSGGVGEISTFVEVGAHRKGVGRALTCAMLPACRAKGIASVRAVILPSNPTALAFYYAMDFRRTSGGYPQKTIAERSTEVIVPTKEQAAVNAILDGFMAKFFNRPPEEEAAVVDRYGPGPLATAKAMEREVIATEMDWKREDMDDGIAKVGQMLRRKYPWLTPSARSSLVNAFVMTNK